jgi:hypothetical protein
MSLYGVELGRFAQLIRNIWNVLKCGAGEAWIKQLDR